MRWMKIVAVVLVCQIVSWAVADTSPQVDTALSDRDLFEQKLNLDHPGLEKVRQAVGEGDIALARQELADYYRHRTGRFMPLAPIGEDDADKARYARSVRSLLERVDSYDAALWRNDLFDWPASNVRHKHRMYMFAGIGQAYAGTGDERIAEALVDLMRSVVFHCPVGEPQPFWASMNVGIRMRTGWPEAFLRLLPSPNFTDDDIVLFLKSVYEQTDYLRHNLSETSNWLTFEVAGLYTSGIVFPEFREAAEWREIAAETAIEDMNIGWLPDGMSIELSPGYGQFFSNYYHIYDRAEYVGRLDEFGLARFAQRTEGPYENYLKIMAPDRTAPATNDNGPVDVTRIMTQALERFPQRDDFRWAATDGEEGSRPDYTSIVLPYAGFAAMRDRWERDGNMLYFDFGPVGYRHAHQDKLQVILWAYGRQILFDPGRQDYSDTRHQNYCLDTFSHNTVLVDNRPQRRRWYANPHPRQMPYTPLDDYQWDSSDTHDYAMGVYEDAYGLPGESDAYPYKKGGNFNEGWGNPAVHYRRVYFHKPDIFVVVDTLESQDGKSHTYDARWHLDSTQVTIHEDGFAVATADADQPNLEIVPLSTQGLTIRTTSAQDDPEILGWRVAGEAQPATTLQHLKTGPGRVQFVTVLLPLKPGQSSRFASAENISPTRTQLTLTDGRTLIIHAPTSPGARLRVEAAGSSSAR